MNKQEIEKSLKRYLKKRISYTFSLLIAFLITGGFATASELNQEVLLSRIKEDREKLEKMLQENYKKEAALQKENLDILKEADFYVKPLNGTLFSMPYFSKKSKNVEKEWQGTVRTPTEHDGMREKFNSLQKGENDLSESGKYTSNYDNRSSGWINKNTNYGKTANSYDVEAKLFILPVVKAPVVKAPTAPAVSFTTPVAPTELKVDAPTAINISMGAISINAPTITAPTVSIPTAIIAPTVATVTVNEPNVAINIGSINVTGPAGLTLPSLTTPTVNVTTKAETPEPIKPPELSVTPPDSPSAPSFTVFRRARGPWLHGSYVHSGSWVGFNNFDRSVRRWVNGPDANGANTSINNAPFFSMDGFELYGNGASSEVTAITKDDGTVINKYTYIATNTTTSTMYPSNEWFHPAPTDVLVSPSGFPGVTAGTYYSYEDNGLGDAGALSNNKYSTKYQQEWIFEGAPTLVRDMTITVGGMKSAGGGTAIFAQTSRVNMRNVNINLKGRTIIADVDTQGDYLVKFDNVKMNIERDFNTILSLSSVVINYHVYPSSSDARPSNLHWGVYRGDLATNEIGVNLGTTDYSTTGSNNAILYIKVPDVHRWNGVNYEVTVPNGLPGGGTKYSVNPGKYQMYYPTPGNIKFENAGTVKFIGSGNAGAWISSYIPDRTKYITGATKPQILNLGKLQLIGDKNVGYYFANNENFASGNGVFQGKVIVDAELGTTLDGSTGNKQIGTGNISGLSDGKSEKNVAVYVASGQRAEMNTVKNNYAQFYPATLSYTVDNVNLYGSTNSTKIWGMANYEDIGAYQLGTNSSIKNKITNLDLSNFTVKFGKYSKDSIALVARNGSAIDLNSTSGITDEAGAESNIVVYAEGVWRNPRKALTSATYDKEAYGRGESETGQKFISDFNTTVNVGQNLTMGSIKSTALFAKDGAIINAKDVRMNGYGSKAVLAYGVKNYTDIVDSNNTNPNKQPNTIINVANITAIDNGTDPNSNIAAIAISQDGSQKGTGNVSVNVSGKVDVHGVGAFARGDKATVTIGGANSNIVSGSNSGLVATDGGTVNFGGGTIEHKIDKQVPFYSANGAKLNFNGDTTIDMYKGVVFYGNATDFSASTGAGKLYNGMNKVTVNLKDHGVN